MTDLDRPGSPGRAYLIPNPSTGDDRRGRLRRSLWQCFCLTWNRQTVAECVKCGRPRPSEESR